MSTEIRPAKPSNGSGTPMPIQVRHQAWHAFIKYCEELGHGQIEILKIQDGLPVLAEIVREKVKFAP